MEVLGPVADADAGCRSETDSEPEESKVVVAVVAAGIHRGVPRERQGAAAVG